MAKLFTVEVATKREIPVVAETQEEAQAKAQPQLKEGEAIASVQEKGDVVL